MIVLEVVSLSLQKASKSPSLLHHLFSNVLSYQLGHKLIMLLLCQMPIPSLRSRRPYTRLYRNVPTSPASKGRPRRSNSSDSYGILEKKETKELSAGQKKAAEDKKGSRHADVIDTWDPTGLGSASESLSSLSYFTSTDDSVASLWSIRRCCSFTKHQPPRQSSSNASFPRSNRSTTRSNYPYFRFRRSPSSRPRKGGAKASTFQSASKD
jgi:hypothetical protein